MLPWIRPPDCFAAMTFAVFLLYVTLTFLRPVEMLLPELAPYRPMLLLGVVALLMAIVRAAVKQESAARGVHFRLLLLLVLAIALSRLFNGGVGDAVRSVNDFSASAILMVLALLNITSLRRLEATCVVVTVCMFLLALAAIAAYHVGFMAADLVLLQNLGLGGTMADLEGLTAPAQDTSGKFMFRVRSVGFLNDPNDFAQALVMVLPLMWGLTQPGRWVRNAIVFLPLAGVMGYAIYLTHSRGAILGIGAMMLFGLRTVIGNVRTGILMGMAVAVFLASSFGGGRGFSSQEESAADRIEAWATGLQMLQSYPIFGVGYRNFTEHHFLTAHNSFVLCFSELGLFGLFAWLALIVVTFRGLTQVADRLPDGVGKTERRMAALLRASLLGFLTCAWFLSRTYQPGMYLLLAICIGAWHCGARAVAAAAPQQVLPVPRWGWHTVAACVASILATYGFVVMHNYGR